jgi:hypothetical protein
MTTLVHKCNCNSEFQDKEYGTQMRLFNETLKDSAICTVCGYVLKTNPTEKKK